MTAHAIQIQPSRPLYPSSTVPFSTCTMPVGQRNTAISNGHTIAVHAHELLQRVAAQARLHEVPVAEQHRVADRAEERGADEQARRGERVRAARELRGGEQAEHAERSAR